MDAIFSKRNSSGFVHLLVPVILVVLVASSFLIYNLKKSASVGSQQVLGKEDSSGSSDDSGSGHGSDSGKNDSPVSLSGDSSNTSGGSSAQSPSATQKPESTQKPEIQKKPELKIETENESEIETESNEASGSSEMETEFEVKDGTETAKIKITNDNGKFKFQEDGSDIQVQTSSPLTVNSDTNRLTVETPEGVHEVTVLPQSVVDSLLASGVLDVSNNIEFQTQPDGSLAYKINGLDDKKFLGIFTISIPKTVSASSETGEVVKVDQSMTSKILDLLSL